LKEVLYTIPLNDAFAEGGECPFCAIERNVENDILDFVLGSSASYMEADIRAVTDEEGFCRPHFRKMFAYGNTLGNAWILKTHYMRINEQFNKQKKHFSETKGSLFKKSDSSNSMSAWVKQREASCYICKRFEETYERYLATFFHMFQNDSDFVERLKNSKGFCITHFGDIVENADKYLSEKDRKILFPIIFDLMEKGLERLQEDVSWMVEKFDYRNKDADWKNSKDALQRGMQKLKGGIYD